MKQNKLKYMRGIGAITSAFCMLAMLTSCGGDSHNYDASGIFEATEILVSAQASGQIVQLNLEEGQVLMSGQSVGLIDTTRLSLQKRQLLASITALQNRKVNIALQTAPMKQEIEKQKIERQRFQSLLDSDAGNRKTLEDIEAQLDILEKRLQAQTESFEKSNRSLAAEIESLEAQLAQIGDQLAKCTIVSPAQGTVLALYAREGELATQGKGLFKLADVESMFLRVYITADQLSYLRLGQEVRVFADSGRKDRREYSGVITWISDKAEFTPKTIQTRDERANLVYAMKVAVKNDGLIKIGMYGEISAE